MLLRFERSIAPEALFIAVEGVLCPGLLVLPSFQAPMTASNLLGTLKVRISVIQHRFTGEDRISPGWDDRFRTSFSSRLVDFTTVIPTIDDEMDGFTARRLAKLEFESRRTSGECGVVRGGGVDSSEHDERTQESFDTAPGESKQQFQGQPKLDTRI